MRFHVLGVGSIGTLISHHLRLNNPKIPITLITKSGRQDPSAPLQQSPPSVVVEDSEQAITSTNYDLEESDPPSEHGVRHRNDRLPPIDSLIVCLKTPYTVNVLNTYKSRISPTSVITLLQNDMGVFDELCHTVWPEERTRPHFIIGTTTHGVTSYHGQNGYVRHRTAPGEGHIKWGVVPDPRKEYDLDRWLWNSSASKTPVLSPPPSPQLPLSLPPSTPTSLQPLYETLTALLSLSNLTPTLIPMPHLHHQLLLKLALNSIINPLTAILGAGALPNGALLNSNPAHRLIKSLSQETSEIITTYLHSLSSPHTPPPDVLRLFTAETLENRVIHLLRSTAANRSSMAADVIRGRITEINNINGYLISLAKRLGVPAPNHQLLVEMVRFTSDISAPNGPLSTRLQDRRDETSVLNVGLPGVRNVGISRSTMEEKRLEINDRRVHVREEEMLEKKLARRREARAHRARKKLGVEVPVDVKGREGEGNGGNHTIDDKARGRGEIGGRSGILTRSLGSTSVVKDPETVEPPTSVPLSMDQLIASAPRHERTWDVLPVPPTARGPVPTKRAEKSKSSSSLSSNVGIAEMMTRAIGSAPRQLSQAIESTTAASSLASIVKAVISPLDHLIASSPRAERTWDVHGGTVTTLGLTSAQSFASSFTASTPTSTLGKTMNDLIAGAPRIERTWPADSGGVPLQGVKGRFITSRTSGS